MHAVFGGALGNRITAKFRTDGVRRVIHPQVLSVDSACINLIFGLSSGIHINPPLILVLITANRLFNP